MAGGPWNTEEDEPPPSGAAAGRLLIWLAALAAVIVGVWLLIKAFPGAVSTPEDWAWVGWGVFMMALFSSAVLGAGRIRWAEKARHAALWAAIVTVLILGVTYRAELAGVGQRVRMTLSPSYPVATGPRELVVTAGDGGHFLVMGKVNGERVRFLVDTGASDTVLSPADARRVGIDTAALRFDRPSETANGVGFGATFQADTLSVGTITFNDVPIIINQAPMSSSLLGMTFLRRLESFQVKDDRLYLTARE
ncbi:MAG: TIGR02281 family clan AA aspartic protease [Phenylobacterium sp.]|uniref:retropepsin-like aspartic protease family protein n=1 Tax=Phenylobacterium sp. TaxID=1871053 RepID=UPI001B7A3802|nr:TIGR02281 family clan AA aspartic protease [Phenylobacterium sp.]MBP7650324.1 TIGR02281 family clan AA aspartic protease [Phenylobacterium sp.]MBP7817695.1 TIGR02281 family clan AA aspartic protease [Phenylobacterium sp.]MBP9230552.1 TIGR02281 family clan AA aspartic protease [Phenylobacterium sp.]